MLGDVFEVWVGDDALGHCRQLRSGLCAQSMRQASQRLDLFVMHGNRDFLMGDALMAHCGATLLSDPCCLLAEQPALAALPW